ncbi:MAG: glycerophosphodiester phosphodiesterase [Bacteroidetes bacterium]|nr:glycerophosphodiester phosphodiesterase [Bacteroidota bacterium]
MLRIGHRGAAGWEPQNTWLSFERAVSIACDIIETDIRICGTGEAVLIHDAKIKDSSGKSYTVGELSLAELRKIDLGKNQKIMTLENLLSKIQSGTRLNLELKSIGSAMLVARILRKAISETGWDYKDFMITSFIHPELIILKNELPEISVGALIKSIMVDPCSYLDDLGISLIVTSLEFITKNLVDEMHTSGKQVYIYTVDDPDDIQSMFDMQVDGIISNYPDRITSNIPAG